MLNSEAASTSRTGTGQNNVGTRAGKWGHGGPEPDGGWRDIQWRRAHTHGWAWCSVVKPEEASGGHSLKRAATTGVRAEQDEKASERGAGGQHHDERLVTHGAH